MLRIFYKNKQKRITNITINTPIYNMTMESKTKTALFTIGYKKSRKLYKKI